MNITKSETRPNILIVDDVYENLLLIKVILKDLNVNLIPAQSGLEALSIIRETDIALALIDINMPDMDGVKLASEIHDDLRSSTIPIIFITAYYKDEVELEKFYSSGAVDFILKPFKQSILLNKVKIFLNLYLQKQQIKEQKSSLEQTAVNLSEINNLLNRRLTFESLLSKISEMAVSSENSEKFLKFVLSVIGETMVVCRSCVFKQHHESNTMSIISEWCGAGVDSLMDNLQAVDCSVFPNWMNSLKNGQILKFSDVQDIQDEAIREVLCPKNVKSVLAIPLFIGGKYDGFIGFNDCLEYREWLDQDVEFLLSISRVIVSFTERKQIERELIQTQLLLKSSLESPKDIIIISIDTNYRYLYFNEVHKFSMKYAYNKDVSIGMNILDCITSETDRNDAKNNFDITFSGKSHITVQKFGDKERKTYENSYNPIKNDRNEVVGLTLFSRDITNRVKAEKELKDSLEQLHQLSKYIENLRENERVSIARELHDDLGQALTAVKIDLGIIRQNIHDSQMVKRITKTEALVSDTIKTVQKITFQLRPKIIDDLGLTAGIDWYTSEFSERTGIKVELDVDPEITVSPEISIVIFRIMQESLTNVVRHAIATEVEIQMIKNENSVWFILKDNGTGISETKLNSKTSFGLIGMKERADSVGGKLEIFRNIKGGTSLKLIFPLNEI